MLRIEDRMETVFTIERKTNVFYNCDIAKNVTVRMKIFRFFLITCATIFAPARLRNIYSLRFFFLFVLCPKTTRRFFIVFVIFFLVLLPLLSFLILLSHFHTITCTYVRTSWLFHFTYVHVKASDCRWLTGPYSEDKTNQPSVRDAVDDIGGYGLCTKAGIPVASGCWLVETEQEIECCYWYSPERQPGISQYLFGFVNATWQQPL